MRNKLTILLFILLSCMSAAAQNYVTGTVKADDGDPLIGVFVYVKGTKSGVMTDLDGKFKLPLAESGKTYTVVFQFLGMANEEAKVKAGQVCNIVMHNDSTLDEALIVGAYGTKQKREDLVGSAFQVNSSALQNKPVARIDNLLDGLVPGLNITPNTDEASSTRPRLNVRVRGNASLAASNEPLWIIDGVVQYMGSSTGTMPGMRYTISPMSYLDPSDIESITVLKDADQVSIYGADGANGVILVTTKGGGRRTHH